MIVGYINLKFKLYLAIDNL